MMDPNEFQVLHFLFWAEDEFGEAVSYGGDGTKTLSFWNRMTELDETHPAPRALLADLISRELVIPYRQDGEKAYKLSDKGRQALMDEAGDRKEASPDLRAYTFDFLWELCPGCKQVNPLLLYPKDTEHHWPPLIFCTCGFLKAQGGKTLNEKDDPPP